jgi:hypothetical protein
MLSIDFLPERVRIQRARRKRLVRQGYLLAGYVAAMCVLAYARHDSIGSARAELAMLEQCAANTQRQLAMRKSLELQQAELNIKKQIEDQLGSRVNTRDILAELSRLMPKSMSVTKFSFEAMDIPQTARPAAGDDSRRARSAAAGEIKEKVVVVKRVLVVVDGLAPNDIDVANFIGQLSACPLFEDVHMGYAKTVEFRGRPGREFQARCYVVR